MIDNNIPEEELNFNSLSIESITSQNQQLVEPTEENNVEKVEEVQGIEEETLQKEEVLNNTTDVVENTVDQPEEKEVDPATEGYSNEAYQAALELAQENGLLIIPENLEGDMTAETWENILSENRRMQYENVFNDIKSQAGDGYVADLLEFAYNGATWDDIKAMQDNIDNQINVNNLDVTNEDHQRYLIEEFLSDGLDPDNPAHKLRLSKIDQDVDAIFDRLESEDMATKAKEFFSARFEQEQALLVQQQEENRLYQQQQEQLRLRQEQEWAENFQNTLESRKWSREKKDAVVSQFDIVELDSGEQVEMWKYKWNNLWKNPQMVQVFMDFMSDIDPYTMEFKTRNESINKQVSSKIQQLLNSKNQKGKNSSKFIPNKRSKGDKPTIIDPRKL